MTGPSASRSSRRDYGPPVAVRWWFGSRCGDFHLDRPNKPERSPLIFPYRGNEGSDAGLAWIPMRVIAVDCGGSNVRTAAADDTGVLGRIAKAGTPDDLGDLPPVISALLRDPHPATALGVGVAGLVDVASRPLRGRPHRPGHDIPLGAQLEGRLGLPVVVDNDANLAALAEAPRGAGGGPRVGPAGA